MRTRFAIDDSELMGYETINPFNDLDKLSDNECSYIFCDNCVDGCYFGNLESELKKWSSKLRLGGVINIVGVDLDLIIEHYEFTRNLENFNTYIESKNGIFTFEVIKNILINIGLQIKSIELNNGYYNIEAFR